MASALRIPAEKTTRDLNLMRQIRNEFAHDMNDIVFDTPHIKSRIDEFHAVAMLYKMTKGTGHSPKERFIKQVDTRRRLSAPAQNGERNHIRIRP